MLAWEGGGVHLEAFVLRHIGQIAIQVQDVDRATAFYRDVLGLEHLFRAPPSLSFFRCGEVRLMLAHPENTAQHTPSSVLYYAVDDVHEAYGQIARAGAEVAHQPHIIHRTSEMELWMAFFHDGEGNTFAVMSEVSIGAPRA
jgi:methylmalonyl-CoA/ethylmalonyl-CoA epimerase